MAEEEIAQKEAATPTAVPNDTKKKMPRKKKILIALGSVVALFILFFALASNATKNAAKTSNQFIDAIQAGDSSMAYSLLSSEAKGTVNSDDFNKVVSQIGPILNTQEKMKSKSVDSETGSASKGTVVYEIKGTDGVTYTITVNLQKDDGAWKVMNFDSKKQ